MKSLVKKLFIYIGKSLIKFFPKKSPVKSLWTKLVWSCSNLAQMKFRENKFRIISNIQDFFWKTWKKIDFKFENFRNFKLGMGFFSDFAKTTSNVRNSLKFIYVELHLSQFSAKSENLFCGRSLRRSLITTRFARGCFRKGAS